MLMIIECTRALVSIKLYNKVMIANYAQYKKEFISIFYYMFARPCLTVPLFVIYVSIVLGLVSAYFLNLRGRSRQIYTAATFVLYFISFAFIDNMIDTVSFKTKGIGQKNQNDLLIEVFIMINTCIINFIYGSFIYFAYSTLFIGKKIIRDEKEMSFMLIHLFVESMRVFRLNF